MGTPVLCGFHLLHCAAEEVLEHHVSHVRARVADVELAAG